MKIVYRKENGERLGSWVSNEANDQFDRERITHVVYRHKTRGYLISIWSDFVEIRDER